MSGILSKSEVFAALPPPWPDDVSGAIRDHLALNPAKVVVLDDDPTGTQTVHGIPVLTEWSGSTLAAELRAPGPGFYILTNSRAFPVEEARSINREIGERLAEEAAVAGIDFIVISRSDSTLRGHFPDEVEALGEALSGGSNRPPILLCPYFEAGGRYTIADVHYVADGDIMVPAGETPFARDAAFGFLSSNLREWVEEKSGGRIPADEVISLSLADIREGGPGVLAEKMPSAYGAVSIANAACQRDLDVIVLGALMNEARGTRTIYRTAASFVATRMGITAKPLLTAKELNAAHGVGGLLVVGSYVPKTTGQLTRVLEQNRGDAIELDVADLLSSKCEGLLADTVSKIDSALQSGRDVILFTSRELVTGADAAQSLAIGARVSGALVEVVQGLATCPRYLIAKGGITSSDLATRGLGVRRAMVLGQILPGVPVWELGGETRFPGLPYIVFPGNVGGPDALIEAMDRLSES